MGIRLKRPAQVDGIAAAGRILADVLDELATLAVPGTSTADLDAVARERIAAAGARPSFLGYRGFKGAICASPNDLVVHGIPNATPLRDGDLLSLDVGVTLDGLVADAARTVPVGALGAADGHLVETAEAALADAVAVCRPGNRIGDIGHAVASRCATAGLQVFPTLIGHGVGFALHEDPQVPNIGKPGTGRPLEPGLVIAIEPMVTLGRAAIRMADDGWSVFTVDGARATHAEVTVAITDDGARVLTPWGGDGRWAV
jgi:methionyl aminopeptidase